MLTRVGTLFALVAGASADPKKKDDGPPPTAGAGQGKEEVPAKKKEEELSLTEKVKKFHGNYVDLAHNVGAGGDAGQRAVKIEGQTIVSVMGRDKKADKNPWTVTRLFEAGAAADKKTPKKTEKTFDIVEKDGKITVAVDLTEKMLDKKGVFTGETLPTPWPLQFTATLETENGRPVMSFPDGNKWVMVGKYDEKFVTIPEAVPAPFDVLKRKDKVPEMKEGATEDGGSYSTCLWWTLGILAALGVLTLLCCCFCGSPDEENEL